MKYLCPFLLSICLISLHAKVRSADLRTDTIDLQHILIHLDITDFTNHTIAGHAQITFAPKMNGIQNLNLDLLKLNVDSVVLGGNQLTYGYNDTLLQVNLGSSYGMTDTLDLTIYYHGTPQIDQSNWGGFYFQNSYAFNLGVGFDADPHNYGRAWFPCFDNFIERSTFTFEIITSDGKTSYCNGELMAEVAISGDTIMRTWQMDESIPSYLACVAVAEYEEVRWKHQGILKQIPVVIAAKENDTTNLKSSFVNFNQAIDAFEDAYGPFLFNKAGYSIVPFTGGAMEHASNVTYPRFAINGTKAYETLMAHEFAHHWWGDLVTCDAQEEMWINEGMASYSEHLFLEHVYGEERYIKAVKENHLGVIQYAHIIEGKYWSVSGVPHEYTYGRHVYDKGASVGHNLRTYLGKANFKAGVNQFMDDYKFSDVNSIKLRNSLEATSGLDLDDFFDDWVFGGGFCHFAVDSFVVSPSPGNNSVTVYIQQKKRGNDHFFNAVPMRVSFYAEGLNEFHESVVLSGQYNAETFTLPFVPTVVALNTDDGLAMAVTTDQHWLLSKESHVFDHGKMLVDVDQITDSALMILEHHWAAPDPLKDASKDYRLSNYRYWRLTGIFPSDFKATARMHFDGRDIRSGGQGNLDNELLVNGTDSVILLYRKDAHDDWSEFGGYEKIVFTGSKYGFFNLDSLVPGEYAYANGVSTIGIRKNQKAEYEFVVSPNPVSDKLRITSNLKDTNGVEVVVFNVRGREVARLPLSKITVIDVNSMRTGNYFFDVRKGQEQYFSGQFVVRH